MFLAECQAMCVPPVSVLGHLQNDP